MIYLGSMMFFRFRAKVDRRAKLDFIQGFVW